LRYNIRINNEKVNMTTTTNLIELLTDAKKNNIGIGECWNLMDEAADLLAAQAKQIKTLQTKLSKTEAQFAKAVASWKTNETTQEEIIAGLQADAERYRVGREAAFAGLLVDFPHTKTWSDAMDFAYDQMIAARKGNV
jgi:DNA repair exonuclease SbcCD ATPase subunit